MVDLRIKLMRRATACLMASTALVWAGLIDTRGGQSAAVGTIRALKSIIPVRPIIYTFTEYAPSREEDTQFMLWKAAWQAAGFDAKNLSLLDATRHSEFEWFSSAINEVLPYEHWSTKMKYLRYLAMSTVGGGFLADMDVFPLWPHSHMNLPKQARHGQFTVHCGSYKQASSCLLSGSAGEWDRIALELLSSAQRQYTNLYNPKSHISAETPRRTWSDDDALQDIISFANPTGRPLAKRKSQVLSLIQARDMFKPSEGRIRKSNCHTSTDRLAVKLDTSVEFVQLWMRQWNEDCVHTVMRADISLPMDIQSNYIAAAEGRQF